jgi:group I intron endonuclease
MNGIHEAQTCEDARNVNPSIGIEKKFIIYKITNLVNKKIYIGQTSRTLADRRTAHLCEANSDRLHYPLYLAMRKHGIENFVFETMFYCMSKQESNDAEKAMIKLFEAKDRSVGYNLTDGGEGNWGRLWSEEQKAKLRGKYISPETRAKMSAWKRDEAFCEKMRNRRHTEESKAKMRDRIVSAETRAKMSKKAASRNLSDATKSKISIANLGRKLSEETKAKMREATLGAHHSEATRAKMSDSMRRVWEDNRDFMLQRQILAREKIISRGL